MATLTPFPVMQFFDNNGDPLSGGKVYTYQAGGPTTPLATYTDAGGGTPNSNPVILDSAGRANIWLDSQLYYWELTDANDVLIWTADDVGSAALVGDVTGPGSSTNNTIVRFDGVTGKIIQGSVAVLTDAGDLTLNSLSLSTDLSISNGGTGASSAAAARTNLGLGAVAEQGDGDKGDIVVSSSGATWTIDALAVTGAKIAAATITADKMSGAQLVGTAPALVARAYCAVSLGGSFGTTKNVASFADLGGGTVRFTFSSSIPEGPVPIVSIAPPGLFFEPSLSAAVTHVDCFTHWDGTGNYPANYYWLAVFG